MKLPIILLMFAAANATAQSLQVQPVQDYGSILRGQRSAQVASPPSFGTQSPQSPTAYWTGQSRSVTTVTGLQGFACSYQYAGQFFERVFAGFCPATIAIQ